MTIDRVLKHHSGEAPLPETETIGDRAGHMPVVDGDRDRISAGIRSLVTISGENSRDHGFHDDWPTLHKQPLATEVEQYRAEVRRAIAEKLALIHEEISEALGEIRSGRDPLDTYFVDHKGLVEDPEIEYEVQHCDANGTPLCKPEGFLVELADAAIRIADLVYLVGGRGEFVQALDIKHEYNATRPHKHGRKF